MAQHRGQFLTQRISQRIEPHVRVRRHLSHRRQPCGHRHRVAVVSAAMMHRAASTMVEGVHQFGAPSHRTDWKAAADDLAETGDVRLDPEFVERRRGSPAGSSGPRRRSAGSHCDGSASRRLSRNPGCGGTRLRPRGSGSISTAANWSRCSSISRSHASRSFHGMTTTSAAALGAVPGINHAGRPRRWAPVCLARNLADLSVVVDPVIGALDLGDLAAAGAGARKLDSEHDCFASGVAEPQPSRSPAHARRAVRQARRPVR